MNEVRLAVCHPNEAARTGIAARVRGAVVEPWAPDREYDAVMLCGVGPPPEELLRSGVRVLLVAEPCPSANTIEILANEARRAGALCAVVNPDRYLPSRQLIRKQLSGPLGDVGLLRSHRWEPGASNEVAGLPEPLLRDLDVALWLADRWPDRVFAREQKSEGGRYVQVHLGFPNDAMALLDFDNRLPVGDGYHALSVIAQSGAAYVDDHQNAQLLYRGGNAQAVTSHERAGQLAALAQEFVNAIREDSRFPTRDWPNVFAVAGAAVKSLASGQPAEPEAP